jgi:orotate phosphoribosyltransferase
MITGEDVLRIFEQSGALLQGHFKLSSGRHSDQYLEKCQVLQYPRNVELLCKELAGRFADAKPTVVIGPTTPGVILAYEVAKQLGVRGIFAEKDGDERVLRRGFWIDKGEKTLIVDDVMTMGGAVDGVVKIVEERGGDIVGIGVIAVRSKTPPDLGYPITALLSMDVVSWAPEECPLCKEGQPIASPGSAFLRR